MPGLRALMEADLGRIVEDATTGFGVAVELTSPNGVISEHVALTLNRAALEDPDTGVAAKVRHTSAVFRTSTLPATLQTLRPVALADVDTAPWLVAFEDNQGVPYIYRVRETTPDDTVGALVCLLEPWGDP